MWSGFRYVVWLDLAENGQLLAVTNPGVGAGW